MEIVNVKIINRSRNPLPSYSTVNSAGLDLRASLDEDIVLRPNRTLLVPTGIYVELPTGFEMQIRPRSGLALKHGVTVLNTPGTVDSDYRGEVCVILINHGTEDFTVRNGDRIAQMVIAWYAAVNWLETDSLSDTARGAGGFGHSGV